MAMVRPSIKMEEPRTTTKILNLYNKSADPSNKTGSLVLTTTLSNTAGGSETEGGDFDASEITVIFEDEIEETLYVGPVEISEEEQYKRKLLEEAAREKEQSRAGVRGGSRKGATLLNSGAASSAGTAGTPKASLIKTTTATPSSSASASNGKLSSPVERAIESISNGSDSGIDNCIPRDDNKKKNNSSSSPPVKDLKVQPQKKTNVQQKSVEMVIKKRGRPPGAAAVAQTPPKVQKMAVAEVKKTIAVKKSTAVTPIRKEVVPPKPKVSPRPQYECDLCEEVFSREDTIVDHYQSYHRVDPKKRSIKPRVNIPKEASPEPEAVKEEEDETEMLLEVATKTPSSSKTHSTKKTKETPPRPGLICGICNLTFRTILLLSRHVKMMHESKNDEEEEQDNDDEQEPEILIQPKQEQKSLLKQRGKENLKEPSVDPLLIVSVAAKKRGRPRKSEESSPRILNADKGLVRVRMADDDDGDDDDDDQEDYAVAREQPASKRGKKRKPTPASFAEDDGEHEVVPKPRTRGPRNSTLKVTEGSGTGEPEDMIFVEVIDEKVNFDDIGHGDASTTMNGSDTTVYKIKEGGSLDKDGNVKYSCHLCDMTFTRRYSLEPHIQRVHQKLRTKECDQCGRKFLATGDLTRHMAIHTGEKPYECSIPGCPFRFVSRSDLAKHELRHTAGVPRTYVCGTCDKSFERPYDLRRHQTTHKDMQVEFRSYNCEHCNRGFTRRDEYRAHMYRHLGVKPLKCHVCGKPFVDVSNCAKHCKGHGPLTHDGPEDPMECGDCNQKFTNQSALGRHMTKCLHERSALPVHTVPQFDYFEDDVK